MSGLKKNLRIVWGETTHAPVGPRDETPRRFVVRAFSDAGPGWGVWDKKRERFLKNREVAALSVDAVRQVWVQ